MIRDRTTQAVRIVKAGHTHADRPVAIGTVLRDIAATTAAHLIALGVAEPVRSAPTNRSTTGDAP